MQRSSLRRPLAMLVFGAALAVHPAFAEPARNQPALGALPELPRAPDLQLKEPSMEELADIDELLARITGEDAAARDDGVRAILELGPRLVPAVRRRLENLASSADKNAMKRLLFDVRKEARDDERDDKDSAGPGRGGPDYLTMLVQRARPGLAAWRDLTKVVALSRMLEQIGTTPAARGIIDVYVRFGDFLRVDTQKALARLGDRAVPALLEARRHQAERIGRWASRQLDAMGRAAPSQAVQIADPGVLADVLRAYGRTRDLDAARIVISFAGSERTQLRDGARHAIAMLGEAGHWQLRDAYEDVVGKRAARDWTWERTARELFGELDRLRRAEVLERFEAGQKAHTDGKLDVMLAAYDEVLARAPFFERADEMVGGYWEYAQKHADESRDRAIAALYRAERLSRGKPLHPRVQSLLLTLEAERLSHGNVIDRTRLRRAVELDPQNSRARERLAAVSRAAPTGTSRTRYAVAGGIGALGILGALFILFAPRRTRRDTTLPAAEDVPAHEPPSDQAASNPHSDPKAGEPSSDATPDGGPSTDDPPSDDPR